MTDDILKRLKAVCLCPHLDDDLMCVQCAAAEEIVLLQTYIARLEAWRTEGEFIMAEANKVPMFSLGEWWGRRPWRTK